MIKFLSLFLFFGIAIMGGITNDRLDSKNLLRVDLNSIDKRPIWDETTTMKFMTTTEFDDDLESMDLQVSNCTFQNVLYSIAKEIHGYK